MNALPTNLALMPNRTIVPPTVQMMLNEIGPCPVEALMLGMCDDHQPAFINLNQEDYPFFVSAPAGWGKTHLLKTTLEFARKMKSNHEISPVVLTDHRDEWMDMANLVRVEYLNDDTLRTILQATENFGKAGRYRYALVLIDGWDSADHAMRDSFLSQMAKRRRVCTIIASRTETCFRCVVPIRQGYRPGQFQTIEKDIPLFFYVPSLE